MMELAFYKGKKRWSDRLIQWWTRSQFSHTEIVLGTRDDGLSECASSSWLDGGVRIKWIALHPDRWVLVDLPADTDEQRVRQWYQEHDGAKYDLLGLLGFVLPFRTSESNWWCSESNADALGYADHWRFSPGHLAARHGIKSERY